MRFWDSSAILPLALDEPSSAAMASLLREDADVVLWWGTPLECASALARAVREGRIGAGVEREGRGMVETLRERAYEIQPSGAVRQRAMRLVAVHPLRAGDALQLAAALVWCREQPDGAGFVSLDGRLSEAATREGFRAISAPP